MHNHFRSRLLFFVAFLLALPGLSLAQTERYIEFDNDKHDFGELKEVDGNAEHTFTFTNTSETPVKLTYVKASCGCTTPEWSRDVVQPGEEGVVKAVYSTANRGGAFSKSITVKVGAVDDAGEVDQEKTEAVHILRISGNVIPKPKGPEDWYPTELGNLRFESNHLAFSKVINTERVTRGLTMYNPNDEPITIKTIDAPGHLEIQLEDGAQVPANDSLELEVLYNAPKVNDYGFITDRLSIYTDDDILPEKTLYVSAELQEDLPDVSNMSEEELAQLPTIEFEEKEFNFGEATEGDVVTHEYKFTNTGGSDLHVRKVKASCGCTAGTPGKETLAPGESTTMKVTFNTTGKPNRQRKSITVITNDPQNPVSTLVISGQVNRKQSEQ